MEEDRVTIAYNTFMTRLFGEVPTDVSARTVERSVYDKHMKDVQTEFGIEQGDPDFMYWVLTLVGRSPRFKKGETE